jgi:PadR family transcriptional regulator, regulatory protein PadR
VARPRHSSEQTTRLLRALCAHPERWRYGYDLSAEAAISAGTLYPALARLADDGLLEHRWELPSENGRPRHLYRLTAAGVEFAAARVAAKRAPGRATRPKLAPS